MLVLIKEGKCITRKTRYRIVRYELKAKLKVPRRSHEKKNDAEEAAFREEFPDKLKTLAEDRENIRVLAQDESRFGLMPATRRRITAKGVKPIQTENGILRLFFLKLSQSLKVQFQFKNVPNWRHVCP